MCVCGGGGADFEPKIRGVNSVSGENLHDFEIISPAREVLVTIFLHQQGTQLKLPSCLNKSIYAISVLQNKILLFYFGFW